MSFSERRVLTQVTVLPGQSAIQVQWANQVLKNDEVISEQFERKAYTPAQKEEFLVEVEDGEKFISMMGW